MYLKDVANLDFTDVYCCRDVDQAADLLTAKLVDCSKFPCSMDFVPAEETLCTLAYTRDSEADG